MEELKTSLFKIVLNCQIGEINQKKADSISKVLGEKFEAKILQEQPFGKAFILANPSRREVVLIAPNSITYQIESEESVSVDSPKVNNYLRTILDSLLTDDTCTGLIHIIGKVQSKSLNSMEDSINIFANDEIAERIPRLKGVGIRYIIEENIGLWEYKIEPFISNPKEFFIEMICNINTEIVVSDIIGVAEHAHADFTTGKKGVLECLRIL